MWGTLPSLILLRVSLILSKLLWFGSPCNFSFILHTEEYSYLLQMLQSTLWWQLKENVFQQATAVAFCLGMPLSAPFRWMAGFYPIQARLGWGSHAQHSRRHLTLGFWPGRMCCWLRREALSRSFSRWLHQSSSDLAGEWDCRGSSLAQRFCWLVLGLLAACWVWAVAALCCVEHAAP